MKSRILGAVAAALLALVGTVLLVSYVNGAEQRAYAGTETKTVLVVRPDVTIPVGTSAEELIDLVTEEAVPVKVVPPDAVSSLGDIAGKVTTVDLMSGEQLLSTRFVDPDSVIGDQAVSVPEGMQEVTVLLEPQRVVGGQIAAGDTVGLLMSLEAGPEGAVTHLSMHKVLVTSVQGLSSEPTEATDSSEAAPIPAGSVLVTLARPAPDVEEIVYAQEFGRIWLTKEPSTASEEGTRPVTNSELFE